MSQQLVSSILIGLLISAVLFLPLVVWQYRRFGRFDWLRSLWSTAGFTYFTGLVAFTIFPLPRSEQCAGQASQLVLSPWRVPQELYEIQAAEGMIAALSSWALWEALLNIVLFVPFGLIVRRVFELPRPIVFAAAVALSLLIETTQYTGNWGLAPCPYRVADVTDLAANTAGAAVGILIERLTPRLLSSKKHLLAQKDRARPVTRGRRIIGIALDMAYVAGGAVIGGSVGAVIYMAFEFTPGEMLTPEQMLQLQDSITAGSWTAAMLVTLLPAITGNGASLGQRTVYLGPRSPQKHKHLLRALSVQGLLVCALFNGFPTVLLVPFGVAAAFTAAVITPRGLSHIIAALGIKDAREDETGTPTAACGTPEMQGEKELSS